MLQSLCTTPLGTIYHMEVLLSTGKYKQIFAFQRGKRIRGTILASNASVKHMRESPHFHHHGSGSFLLVEAPPQSPQDTILYPGNAAKMQRLRDFSNRLWTLNVLLFRILSPWYAYPPPESCPHLPWQFAENASPLWPFDSLHTWLFSRTKAERIPLASS